jgi:membrane associated rhomboid family serine protease
MAVLEIGGRRSRLVVSAAAFIAGVFLLQLLMFRVNPHHQRGPYFEPNGPPSIRVQATRPEAPDPLTQLLWCCRADTVGRLWLWQLLTLGFAHSPSSLWPLLVGLLGLWLFGPALEQGLGLASTLGLWFAASAAAGLTTCAVSPDAPTLSCLASALALAGPTPGSSVSWAALAVFTFTTPLGAALAAPAAPTLVAVPSVWSITSNLRAALS